MQQVWVWKVWWYMIYWFDLPKLSSLSLDCDSFANTRSITLSSISLIFSSSDVPFSNGHYSIDSRYSSNWTFRYITSSSITSDSTSSRLKNCIINKGCSWIMLSLLFPPHLNSLMMLHTSQKSIPAILPSHIPMFILGIFRNRISIDQVFQAWQLSYGIFSTECLLTNSSNYRTACNVVLGTELVIESACNIRIKELFQSWKRFSIHRQCCEFWQIYNHIHISLFTCHIHCRNFHQWIIMYTYCSQFR